MESLPQTHPQESHILHSDLDHQEPSVQDPVLLNIERAQESEPKKWYKRIFRPSDLINERFKIRARALAAAALVGIGGVTTTDNAEAGDKYGLEAFAKAVAVNVVNQKLSTTPAQIRITPNGPIVVPNANMQVAPELIMKPGVKEYLQSEGLQVSSSPMFIRVIDNPSSGVAFEQDTRAVEIRRNATGLDLSRYYMRGNIPYVKVTPIHTQVVIQNGIQQKIIIIGSGVESPIYVQK